MVKNKLFIDFKHALFTGHLQRIQHHQHTTGAVCVSTGKDIIVNDDETDFHSNVFYIPQNTQVHLSCDSPMVIYNFEPDTQSSESLAHSLGVVDVRRIHPLSKQHRLVEAAENLVFKDELSAACVSQFAHAFAPSWKKTGVIEPRIHKVLAAMHSAPDYNYSIAELMAVSALSKSRLTELFKANTGLAIRRYRIWLRLIYAAHFLSQGLDLTQAASHAGFSDSAHLSNSCRKLLGISPIDVLSQPMSLRIFTGSAFSDNAMEKSPLVSLFATVLD